MTSGARVEPASTPPPLGHSRLVAGRTSLRPSPPWRFSSSALASARSLHLVLCRDPERCSASPGSLPVLSFLGWWLSEEDAMTERSRSSGRPSPGNGRT
jgi:hypothetical protein